MNYRLTKVALAIALATSLGAEAKQSKVDICHYGDEGLKILNLPVKAANKHIQRHSDFLPFTLYEDADLDGYGNADVSIQSCEELVYGYSDNDTDLDDTDPWITDGSDDADDDDGATPPPAPAPTAAPMPPPSAAPMPPPTASPMPPPPPPTSAPTSAPMPPPPPPSPPGF